METNLQKQMPHEFPSRQGPSEVERLQTLIMLSQHHASKTSLQNQPPHSNENNIPLKKQEPIRTQIRK